MEENKETETYCCPICEGNVAKDDVVKRMCELEKKVQKLTEIIEYATGTFASLNGEIIYDNTGW